ncbi:GDSL esterase/lipase At4g10955 [Eucalyptus grandis]|uniref:GDSL esterase/lipase At4g10955 n=1 Tax=Eucalyptus grandis TaxID=71139 RepID=UPI00192ECB8F|nr:GDSL esterase/lipase At4g10955 [Eucalyptus grandis]XP_018729496.2 GDSL esterase/lipase At4g10955 [Eucalyptus grandis]XP_018729499.2 GDSL esterase/lipase At4g10955 [Eucalyptus grandis]
MAIKDQIFHLSGPWGLTRVDWKNAAHVRAVVACLVQCVYVLERDRQKKRKGDKALTLPWCETFGFKLKSTLEHNVGPSIFGPFIFGPSIFGAIFEFKPPTSSCNHSAGGPRFVVAFRGTLFKKKSLVRDIKLDFQVILNEHHSSSCCQTAIQAVEDLVATAGDSREVWLTGHSLGSAIALQAGKNMAKKEVYLESLLFNPPYPSVPTEKIKSKSLKLTLHLAKSVLRAGVAVAKQSPLQRKQSESSFAAMSPWVPKLFVNEADYVCFEYIGYFGYGNWMRKHRLENIYKFASQYSLRSLLFMSKKESQAEPLHLIPSAYLTINSKPPKWFLSAHGIREWWKPNLELESEVYQCEY